jgi:hypothetical protein
MNYINFDSIKKFNKTRKRLLLGKDDNGQKVYPYDFVRLQMDCETRTSYCSRIYWNNLDGAFVDSHPAHILLNGRNNYRNLRDYLGKKDVSLYYEITCVKITAKEYEEWLEEQEKKKLKQ